MQSKNLFSELNEIKKETDLADCECEHNTQFNLVFLTNQRKWINESLILLWRMDGVVLKGEQTKGSSGSLACHHNGMEHEPTQDQCAPRPPTVNFIAPHLDFIETTDLERFGFINAGLWLLKRVGFVDSHAWHRLFWMSQYIMFALVRTQHNICGINHS